MRMKKNRKQAFRWTSGIMLALLMATQVHAQQPFVYARDGRKVYLEYAEQSIIRIVNTPDTAKIDNLFWYIKALDSEAFKISATSFVARLTEDVVKELKNKEHGADFTATKIFKSEDGGFFWTNSSVLVKTTGNIEQVEKELDNIGIKKYEIESVGLNGKIVDINLSDAGQDVIDISNKLYKSGNVEYAHPNWVFIVNECENSHYDLQWNLHGGDNLEGINLHDAWDLTDGNGVKVALLDCGVYLTHPDLAGNMGAGFDALGYNNDGRNSPEKRHGTQVAGVITAEDNNIGVKGIAYKSSLLSIRCFEDNIEDLTMDTANEKYIIKGIYVATDSLKADILTMPFVCSNPRDSMISSIPEALCHAATNGRNGKGCVLVASAGNDNVASVVYPASDKNTIAVGATDPQGNRLFNYYYYDNLNFSSYGEQLDIMAPGVNVPTTTLPDRGYYRLPPDSGCFGTSISAPHVAGVAALMLSANPNLTRNEVYAIMMATARKTGNVPYSYKPGRIYGTWNNEMGYGLLNADSAVRIAFEMAHSGHLYIRDNVEDTAAEPNLTTHSYANSPDIHLFRDGQEIINPHSGEIYEARVTVHNCDSIDTPMGRKVKLYWGYVSNIMPWSNAWMAEPYLPCYFQGGGYVGEYTLPHIQAGSSCEAFVTVELPPLNALDCPVILPYGNARWGYSLIAVVDNGPITPGELVLDYNIDQLVAENNNVARKNFTILQDGQEPVVAAIRRVGDPENLLRLTFRSEPCPDGSQLHEMGDVIIRFYDTLKYAIESRNIIPAGCDYLGDGTFLIRNNYVVFDSLDLGPNTLSFLSAEVHFPNHPAANLPLYTFDIISYELTKTGRHTTGIVGFSAAYNEDSYINIQALSNTQAISGDTVCFHAQSHVGNVEFDWFNDKAEKIGTGETLEVTASTTQKYYLVGRITSEEMIGYDSVSLSVLRGRITSVSPNPARGEATISYRLQDGTTSVRLVISDPTGKVFYNTVLDESDNKHVVQIHTLPAGQYMVRIEANGAVLDSKILIVY